jgi:formylmethanofuran dehydrogenase subunit E
MTINPLLETLLAQTAARHHHLCPRQVLGVRLGLFGLKELGLLEEKEHTPYHNHDKRLLTIVETDGCGADGIAVATNCAIGRRTLRVMDFGKVAATLVDTHSGRALRIAPSPTARQEAICHAADAPSRWHAYLEAYQTMPDASLFQARPVQLIVPISEIISTPNQRAICDLCGEEIVNQRQIHRNDQTLCRPCAGIQNYWRD